MTESAPMPLYNESTFSLKKYSPYKVRKIFLNTGFTCPNRNRTKGLGGCIYRNNQTFDPEYCRTEEPVTRQLEGGRQFFAHKRPDMKYLACFRVYTNTYDEFEGLKRKHEEALSADGVVGSVTDTRSDCTPDSLLHYLEELNKHPSLLVEYGIETTRGVTLKHTNRGHTYADAMEAVQRTATCGILTGGHVIFGLPGESREEITAWATESSRLLLIILKMHQLQLVRGTKMAREFELHPEGSHLFSVDGYTDLMIDYVEHLRPDLIPERFVSQSPKESLIASGWGLKNYEFTARVQRRMKEGGAYQGKAYSVQKKRTVSAERMSCEL